MPPDPYQPVLDTPPISQTTEQAAAAINRTSALDRLRSLLGPSFSSATVTTDYGSPAWGTGQPHTGIDLAAAEGTPIQEPVGGTIRFAQDSVGGNQAIVTTPQGFKEVYAHLAAFPPGLLSGATVAPGQLIGYVGRTGTTNGGAHLHYEVANPGGIVGTMFGTVDPLAFIGEFVPAASGPTGPASDPNARRRGNGGSAPPITVAQAKQGFDASKLPGVSALDAISQNIGHLTGDLTNPQTWARLGLTLAAVGLIGAGITLYVVSSPTGQRAAATAAKAA